MLDFHSRREVKAGRKEHTCAHCGKPIAVGEGHLSNAQMFEGYFDTYREHHDCHAAWRALWQERDLVEDAMPFLRDDELEQEDIEFLRADHPAVAERLGLGT